MFSVFSFDIFLKKERKNERNQSFYGFSFDVIITTTTVNTQNVNKHWSLLCSCWSKCKLFNFPFFFLYLERYSFSCVFFNAKNAGFITRKKERTFWNILLKWKLRQERLNLFLLTTVSQVIAFLQPANRTDKVLLEIFFNLWNCLPVFWTSPPAPAPPPHLCCC